MILREQTGNLHASSPALRLPCKELRPQLPRIGNARLGQRINQNVVLEIRREIAPAESLTSSFSPPISIGPLQALSAVGLLSCDELPPVSLLGGRQVAGFLVDPSVHQLQEPLGIGVFDALAGDDLGFEVREENFASTLQLTSLERNAGLRCQGGDQHATQ